MCGIFGYIGDNPQAPELVLDGLKKVEYRGYDSWGVAVIPDNSKAGIKREIVVKKRPGKIGAANVDDLPAGSLALGHTRWATHGGITQANAHPHLDCTHSVAVVHNGIFENYLEIKRELEERGHTFRSETDTEVVAHLIEEKLNTLDFAQAVRKSFLELKGLSALVAIHSSHRELIAVRDGSPLVLGFGTHENYLASDPAALLPYTRKVYFLEDAEMAHITQSQIELTDINTAAAKLPSVQQLNWNVDQAEKGSYRYFMEKEIFEQPSIISAIADSASDHHRTIASQIKEASNTYLIGCGTAYFAALAGQYLFSEIADQQVRVAMGSEFPLNLKHLKTGDIIVALSQSGETMDLLEPLRQVRQRQVKLVAVVNVLGSSLYRMADETVLIEAGPEKAVASTKAFTGKLAHLILLAYAMADQLDEGKRIVNLAVQSMKSILAPSSINHLKSIAKLLENAPDLYILGRGISYPVSMEAALKIKEISYLHAEGLAAGELKHGTLALIESGTPCLFFLPQDRTYNESIAGAMEVKARGGTIIGISPQPHKIFDEYIPVPDAREASIIPNTLVAQLLAYYLTLEKGLDPDMPRNLAKSVTVK